MELSLPPLGEDDKKIVSRLKSIGIERPSDLILYMPTGYINTGTPSIINKCELGGGAQYFKLRVLSTPTEKALKNNLKLITFKVTDGYSFATLSCFANTPQKQNNFSIEFSLPAMLSSFVVNDELHCFATVELYKDYRQLKLVSLVPSNKINAIVPEYKGAVRISKVKQKEGVKPKEGAKPKKKRTEIKSDTIKARVEMAFSSPDVVRESMMRVMYAIRKNQKTILEMVGARSASLYECLYKIHFPSSIEEANEAKEELTKIAIYQIYCNSRDRTSITDESCRFGITRRLIEGLVARLPFTPTKSQMRSIWEICKDLNKNKPMRRILSGDVGVGKTTPCIITAVAAHLLGRVVAIMIPNVLVAAQVCAELKACFPEIPTLLLKKGDSKKKGFSLGDNNPILIGTSSLIFALKDTDFRVDYLIVDEQHRMGVEQREILKNSCTHSLEATATAIPRTMAIIFNGGLDISIIDEQPVYKDIRTVIMDDKDKRNLFMLIRESVAMNRQVAIIYPIVKKKEEEIEGEGGTEGETLISGNEEPGDEDDNLIREVVVAGEKMEKLFPGKVCVLHGKMSQTEKDQILGEMKDGRYNIMIASTVIEIGVTIPGMALVAVVDADRYGATTLHQLRGRIDRKGEITAEGGHGTFVMMVRRKMNQKIRDRLGILVRHNDGFKIAEEDMMQRGFGDLSKIGSRQSGHSSSIFMNLKIPHEMLPGMFEYYDSLEKAQENAA